YQSWAFRQSRVRRMGMFQVQPPEEVARNLALEQAENGQFYEVFLGTFVNNYRYDDFSRPNSIWRIALVTPEGEMTPLSVDRIGRADLPMRALYPYMSDFWVAYRVRFAKAVGAGSSGASEKVLFRVASTLGKSEMWFSTE